LTSYFVACDHADFSSSNAERKLTPEQRRDKKLKKLQEDTSVVTQTCVFKVISISLLPSLFSR